MDEPPVSSDDTNPGGAAEGQQTEDDKMAEEEARKKAEEEAAKKAAEEEEARKKAEEEAAKKAAEEEEARKKAEEEAAKKAAEEEARKKAEEEAAKKAAEEEARKKAEEEDRKKEEEQEKPQPPSGGIVVPGFGGIGGLGGGSSEDTPQAQLGDGSALVPVLEAVLDGSTGDLSLDARALTNSDYWNISNWFPGLSMADGTKVAAATPGISSNAHAVILFEVADGVDAGTFASELNSHADPRWEICAAAESVQYKVSGNRILFVMSSTEIADAVIAAFNG